MLAGSTLDPPQWAVCNVGSSCREEYIRANGTSDKMWVEGPEGVAESRLGMERNRLKLNEYQVAIVPKYTEVSEPVLRSFI